MMRAFLYLGTPITEMTWGIGNMNALGRTAHRVLELSRMQGRREVGATSGLMVTVRGARAEERGPAQGCEGVSERKATAVVKQ
jgi:hypothetical protein